MDVPLRVSHRYKSNSWAGLNDCIKVGHKVFGINKFSFRLLPPGQTSIHKQSREKVTGEGGGGGGRERERETEKGGGGGGVRRKVSKHGA